MNKISSKLNFPLKHSVVHGLSEIISYYLIIIKYSYHGGSWNFDDLTIPFLGSRFLYLILKNQLFTTITLKNLNYMIKSYKKKTNN